MVMGDREGLRTPQNLLTSVPHTVLRTIRLGNGNLIMIHILIFLKGKSKELSRAREMIVQQAGISSLHAGGLSSVPGIAWSPSTPSKSDHREHSWKELL